MDLAGASRAYQKVMGRIVTVGVEAISFHQPIFLGDEVSFYTKVFKIGRSSITIKIESWALRHTYGRNYEYIKVTEGLYTYVHIDENRQPTPIQRG
jgi:acyl-CoA thioesterase YciA